MNESTDQKRPKPKKYYVGLFKDDQIVGVKRLFSLSECERFIAEYTTLGYICKRGFVGVNKHGTLSWRNEGEKTNRSNPNPLIVSQKMIF